jgi:hypothetical protein
MANRDQGGTNDLATEWRLSRGRFRANRDVKPGEILAQAMAEKKAACAWVEDYNLKQDVAALGAKMDALYRNLYGKYEFKYLHLNNGVSPSEAARIALRWFWVAQRNSQLLWLAWEAGNHPYSKSLKGNGAFSAFLKAGYEGDIGIILSNSETEKQFFNAERIAKYFNGTLLELIGMTWFCKANDLIADGKTMEALDVIADAFYAINSAQSQFASNEAEDSDRARRSDIGKTVADAKHSKPGGSRDKAENIRTIWGSGKYTSRDVCAEQECAAAGTSFSTARKALRNTPEPT